jgi:hypothetical protein
LRNFKRCWISTSTFSAISVSSGESFNSPKNWYASAMFMRATSPSVRSPTRTYSALARSRDPPQSGHDV